MPAVNVDHVPLTGRPVEVEKALNEALVLRNRLRAAQEEAAAAEAEYDQRREADVADASLRARKGAPLGAVPAAVEKARQQVELAKRNAAAIGLASEAAQADVVSTMREHSDEWLAALEGEQEQERERALAALGQFEQALAAVRGSASAANWLRAAVQDGRFDRPVSLPVLGSAAPSSAKRAVNGEAFAASDVIAWAQELVQPPPAPPRHLTHAQAAPNAA